jgi:hypothetical protein
MSHGHWGRVFEIAEGVVIANAVTQWANRPRPPRQLSAREMRRMRDWEAALKAKSKRLAWEATPEGQAALAAAREHGTWVTSIVAAVGAPAIVTALLLAAGTPRPLFLLPAAAFLLGCASVWRHRPRNEVLNRSAPVPQPHRIEPRF